MLWGTSDASSLPFTGWNCKCSDVGGPYAAKGDSTSAQVMGQICVLGVSGSKFCVAMKFQVAKMCSIMTAVKS